MKQECLGSFTLEVDILLFHIFKFKEKAPSFVFLRTACNLFFELIWFLLLKWNFLGTWSVDLLVHSCYLFFRASQYISVQASLCLFWHLGPSVISHFWWRQGFASANYCCIFFLWQFNLYLHLCFAYIFNCILLPLSFNASNTIFDVRLTQCFNAQLKVNKCPIYFQVDSLFIFWYNDGKYCHKKFIQGSHAAVSISACAVHTWLVPANFHAVIWTTACL